MQINIPTKVQLMHADPVVNAGLKSILCNMCDLNLCVDDSNPLTELSHTVVITDYRSGTEMMRQQQYDDVRVLIITHCDKEWEIRQAVQSGVHGYVLQNCVLSELEPAIVAISSGQHYLSEEANRSVADSWTRSTLTVRETDVLHLLGKGYCNKLIARELGIGVGTVKSHLKAVMAKLNVSARTQAVIVATQRGLLMN